MALLDYELPGPFPVKSLKARLKPSEVHCNSYFLDWVVVIPKTLGWLFTGAKLHGHGSQAPPSKTLGL